MIVDTGKRDMLMFLFRQSLPKAAQTDEFVLGYLHALFEEAISNANEYCDNRRQRYEALHFEGFVHGIQAGMRIASWQRRESK